MFLLSQEDKNYLGRMWHYWRNRRDNPLVIYGRARSRRIGTRALFFLFFCISVLGGLVLPWGGWILAAVFASHNPYGNQMQSLIPLFFYSFFGVMGTCPFLPALSLSLFAHGSNDAAQLTDLAVTATPRSELALGAVWNGVRAYGILIAAPMIGLLAAAVALPVGMLIEEGMDEGWTIVAVGLGTALCCLAAVVTCLWTLLPAIRCWLAWRGKLAWVFLRPPLIAALWLTVPWTAGIGFIWGAAWLAFEILDFSLEEFFIIATLACTFVFEILLVIPLTIRLMRGAGFLAGEKYFRILDPAELEDRSWLANEAASRAEGKLRKAAAKELRGRFRMPPLLVSAGLVGAAGALALIWWGEVELARHITRYLEQDFYFASLIWLPVIWPTMAFLPCVYYLHRKGLRISYISGGLLPTANRLILRFWFYAAGPSVLFLGGTIAGVNSDPAEAIVLSLIAGGLTLVLQLLVLMIAAATWLRFRGRIWVVVVWFWLFFMFLAGMTLVWSDFALDSGFLALVLGTLLFLPGIAAQYLLGFRFLDWIQQIHDRHLRGVPRHVVVDVCDEVLVDRLDFEADS